MIKHNYILISAVAVLFAGCASVETQNNIDQLQVISSSVESSKPVFEEKITFAENEEYIVLISKASDTLESLAKEYLGDENKAWQIADFNNIQQIVAQREIVIPLKPQNPGGVFVNGYQTIPILCYHRFGDTGHVKLTVQKEKFRQQMQYLKDNDYHVIPMSDMYKFISGKEQLPKKSVIITIDDGYRSTYEIAYPILKELDFPATLFLYTDFTGAGDAVKWSQVKKMAASGIIDIQPHSKSHPNMTLLKSAESKKNYQRRIFKEIDNPSKKIKKYVKAPLHTFAYPYGDTNEMVIDHLKETNYKLAVTVQPGGNPIYAHPYMLRRTMIFGDHNMTDFENALVVFKDRDLK